MAVQVGELFATLKLDKGAFDKGVRDSGGFFGGLANVAKTAAVGTVVALGTVGVAAGKLAIDFQTSMANVHTLIGSGSEADKRIAELGEDVKRMSVETGKSLDDLSGGLYQTISAFGDTADASKFLEISAKASTAGLASTQDAVNLLSSVTKGYGDVSVESASKVSDLAFLTVKLGQTTFPELAASMGKAVPLASALGVSMEELFGAEATLTGVTGNTAEVTTQLRGAFQALLNTNPKMVAALKSIGFGSGEAAIKQLGLAGTLDALSDSVDGDTKKLAEMFGSVEALNAVLALTGPQAESFAEKTAAMGEAAGATEEAFAIQQKTVGASLNRIGKAFEVILVSIGEKFLPVLADVADFVLENMPKIGAVFEDVFGTIGSLIGGVTDALGSLFGGARSSLGPLTDDLLPALGEHFQTIATVIVPALQSAFEGFVSNVVPILQAAFTGFVENVLPPLIDGLGFVTETVLPALAEAISWISETILPPIAAAFQAIAENVMPILGAAFQTIVDVVRDNWPTISSIAEQVGNAVRIAVEAISAVIRAVAPVIRWLAETIFPILGAAAGALLTAIDVAFKAIGVIWNAALTAGKAVVDALSSAFNALVGVFRFVGDTIASVFRNAMNFLIGIVNGIIGAVNSIQVHIGRIGLDTPAGFIGVGPFDWWGLQLPKLKYLAEGGLVTAPTLAMLGENNRDEVVLPLDDPRVRDLLRGSGEAMVRNYNLTVQGDLRAPDEPSVLVTLQRMAEVAG